MDRVGLLVIEDEPIAGIDIANDVIDAGFDLCGVAGSGQEALTIAESNPPSVALVDVSLIGRMSGIEAARRLNSQYGTKIIFITGYAIHHIALRADFPYLGVLSKPYSRDHLLQILSDVKTTSDGAPPNELVR